MDELLEHRYDDENSLALFMEELKKDVKVCDFLRMRLEIVLRTFGNLDELGVELDGSVNKLFISKQSKAAERSYISMPVFSLFSELSAHCF